MGALIQLFAACAGLNPNTQSAARVPATFFGFPNDDRTLHLILFFVPNSRHSARTCHNPERPVKPSAICFNPLNLIKHYLRLAPHGIVVGMIDRMPKSIANTSIRIALLLGNLAQGTQREWAVDLRVPGAQHFSKDWHRLQAWRRGERSNGRGSLPRVISHCLRDPSGHGIGVHRA
jgi:hypothetical protein